MTILTGLKRFSAGMIVISGLAAASHSVQAQEISDDHLAAARTAIAALGSTDQFDRIIPGTAEQLKVNLIRANADLQEVISTTVDEEALKIVPRRSDLEKEAAQIYAKAFSKEELTEIAEFYSSPTGKKLIESGPLVIREVMKAAEIWSSGVARDLNVNVSNALAEKVGERPRMTDDKQ